MVFEALTTKWGTARKLTIDQARSIREDYGTGNVTQRELAARYRVSQYTIWQIIRETRYRTDEHIRGGIAPTTCRVQANAFLNGFQSGQTFASWARQRGYSELHIARCEARRRPSVRELVLPLGLRDEREAAA